MTRRSQPPPEPATTPEHTGYLRLLVVVAVLGAVLATARPTSAGPTLTVVTATDIAVESGFEEGALVVVATLRDVAGLPITGATIVTRVGDADPQSFLTDYHGVVLVHLTSWKPGSTMVIEHPGTPHYMASEATLVLPSPDAAVLNLTVAAFPSVLSYGGSLTVIAELMTGEGAPRVGAPTTLTFDGLKSFTGTTDEAGALAVSIPAGALTAPGRHGVVATADDLTASTSYTVELPTTTTVEVTPGGDPPGATVIIRGKVSCPLPSAISGEKVVITIDGAARHLLPLDPRGQFVGEVDAYALLEGITDDTATLRATFPGNGTTVAASLSSPVEVPVPDPPPLSPVVPAVILGLVLASALAVSLVGALRRYQRRPKKIRATATPTTPRPEAVLVMAEPVEAHPSSMISGVVWDPHDGRRVQRARVTLRSTSRRGAELEERHRGATFSYGPLPAGSYDLMVEAAGYRAASFRVTTPHQGGFEGLTIQLVSFRKVALELFGRLLAPALGGRNPWGSKTPRELVGPLAATYKRGHAALHGAVLGFEASYFGADEGREDRIEELESSIDEVMEANR